MNNDEEFPTMPMKVPNAEIHRQALLKLVSAVIQDFPNTEEQFQALRSPTAYTLWKNSMGGRITWIRKGAVTLGDVNLLRHSHTLLAELQACEGTLEQLGPNLHIN